VSSDADTLLCQGYVHHHHLLEALLEPILCACAQEYIRHLIFEVLADGSIVEVLRKLMKLPWGEAEPYLLKCLLKVRRVLTRLVNICCWLHSCMRTCMRSKYAVCTAAEQYPAGKGGGTCSSAC
jgi:uncharacterized protein (DUF2236 family)